MPGILARVAGLVARMRSLYHGLLRRDDIESKMLDEFRHHIEMRSADLVRQGVEPGEAARRAHVEFGHMDSHRERARASRGLHLFDQARFSWIDVKLALRMLVKHPLLTVAAVLALAVGIPVGLAPAHLAQAIEAPLPGDTTTASAQFATGIRSRWAFPRLATRSSGSGPNGWRASPRSPHFERRRTT